MDLKNRQYMAKKFKDYPPKEFNLDNIIATYFDGIKWKVIPLFILTQYPIIYDKYYEKNNTSETLISIYVCPYTLYSCVYFGRYELYDKILYGNISIINMDNEFYIQPIINKAYSLIVDKPLDIYIRKAEVKILTFKNVVYLFPDSLFIRDVPKRSELNVISLDNNKLVYIIEYKSKKGNDYKYTVLVPKINSFDIIKNGFGTYFHKMANNIRTKGGIIHTCFLDNFKETGIAHKIIDL